MKEPYPQRRDPRLKGWDYGQNGAYFITICTKNRDLTLGTVVGGDAHIAPHVRLTALGELARGYLLSVPGILKFVVMPNHVHFIVALENGPMWASAPTEPGMGPAGGPMWASAPTGADAKPAVTIPKLVRSYKTLVTKACGVPVWQRGYHDHIIRTDEEFRRIWTYVDNNPLKWELDEYYTE